MSVGSSFHRPSELLLPSHPPYQHTAELYVCGESRVPSRFGMCPDLPRRQHGTTSEPSLQMIPADQTLGSMALGAARASS